MTRHYDLVVFDWDGTLMDSESAIVDALNTACVAMGLPVPPLDRARYVIGLGLEDALRYAVPDLQSCDYAQLVKHYRRRYLSYDKHLRLFPGIFKLIAWLRRQNCILAVATGKSRAGLTQALENTALTHSFHATRCADESFSKPHPAMLEELMDEFCIPAERCLMIGDTTHDLNMAKNAGVEALAVSYGAHSAEVLMQHSPLDCVHSVENLYKWLQKYL